MGRDISHSRGTTQIDKTTILLMMNSPLIFSYYVANAIFLITYLKGSEEVLQSEFTISQVL